MKIIDLTKVKYKAKFSLGERTYCRNAVSYSEYDIAIYGWKLSRDRKRITIFPVSKILGCYEDGTLQFELDGRNKNKIIIYEV